MFSLSTFVLAFVASLATFAHAYDITQPVKNATWASRAPGTVAWVKNSTDASNFTIILTQGGTTQVLAAFVNGAQLNESQLVYPTSGGFPVGTGYQIALVKDADDLTKVYATSQPFNIVASNVTVSTSSTAGVKTTGSSQPDSTTSGSFSDPTTTFSGASHNAVILGNMVLAVGALFALL